MDLGSRDAHPLQRKPCGAHPLQRRLCSAHPLQRRQCFAHPLQRRQCGAHMPTLYRDDSVVPTLLQECDSSLTVYCTVLSVLPRIIKFVYRVQCTYHRNFQQNISQITSSCIFCIKRVDFSQYSTEHSLQGLHNWHT